MPVSVPVVRAGNIVTPQFVPPEAIGVTVASNRYLFDTTDDFFQPEIADRLDEAVNALVLEGLRLPAPTTGFEPIAFSRVRCSV